MNLRSSGQQKNYTDTFFILHPLSLVIFATAAVVAFVLLVNSRFNFHCYTQREPTPTQKSARKWHPRPFATSCTKDCEGHSLEQTSFTEPPNTHTGRHTSLICMSCFIYFIPSIFLAQFQQTRVTPKYTLITWIHQHWLREYINNQPPPPMKNNWTQSYAIQ